MISGMIVSRALIVKISNHLMLHRKRGSGLKSSSTGAGQTEKFVKHGAHRKRKFLKVIFNKIYKYPASTLT